MASHFSDDLTLGRLLSRARARRGVSIDEASAATRISPRVIEAFENDDYDAMPPRGYARNMLAAYSSFLGLDRRQTADLYADGFEAAANGIHSRGYDEYRKGRPIDVSTASWVDPNAGRKSATRPRPSVSKRRFDPYGSQDARYGGDATHPGTAREDLRLAESQMRHLRHRSTLERPGIDDERSPQAVTGYHHGSADQTRSMGRVGAGQRRPQRDRNGRPSAAQQRQARQDRQSSREARRRAESTDGRGTGGFGRGFGLLREREDARRAMRDASLPNQLRRFLPLVVVAVIVVAAVVLIATANSHHNGETIQVVSSSQAATASGQEAPSVSGASAQAASGTVSYQLSVADGATCRATVAVDGSQAYSGTIVGPQDQTFNATGSIAVTVSQTDGVTLTKDGEQVELASDGSGGAGFEETLARN